MSRPATELRIPSGTLDQLAAAPHRLMFFIGATNVLLAMAWWALWLVDARWQLFGLQQPAAPAGWLHAMIMQYQVLPSFMFGFLLTVFPRWMNLPALTRVHYVPVGAGMFGGQMLTLVGLFAGTTVLRAGAIATFIGWSIGTALLVRLVFRDGGKTSHAVSCVFALSFGLLGLTTYILYLQSFDPKLMFMAIKIGSTAVLLPIYFTVCHRMIPFFTSAVVPQHPAYRPEWMLGAFWVFALVHTWLELVHGYGFLWVVDVPLAMLAAWLLWKWWPRGGFTIPPLLRVLFVGFAWLPIAFAAYAAQSAWFAASGEFVLGRAPAHALFVGFFGSLLVAMVTRVTQGHSGRLLSLGWLGACAFVLVQWTAIVRVLSELSADSLAWQGVAAIGWLVAFLPWAMRSAWIYCTPRTDGRAG
jgi:uncharacterized protein involved in response to NO